MFAQKDFEIETVLHQPLMAHLSTVDQGGQGLTCLVYLGRLVPLDIWNDTR